ncbi:MAG: hypothetical protein Q9178_002212 [Gyalolechia marmorata]
MPPPPPTSITFITGNKNKLAEVQAILASSSSSSSTLSTNPTQIPELKNRSLELVEIQGTVEDICKDKCRRAADLIGEPVLVEDTCLGFMALKGLPGPYIKWFLEALGHEGLNNLLAAYEDKTAEAITTFAYSAGPGNEPLVFEGRVQGKIVPARGPLNFGWDPIFEYQGETYAEMDKAKKNKISHRSIALAKFKDWLQRS